MKVGQGTFGLQNLKLNQPLNTNAPNSVHKRLKFLYPLVKYGKMRRRGKRLDAVDMLELYTSLFGAYMMEWYREPLVSLFGCLLR